MRFHVNSTSFKLEHRPYLSDKPFPKFKQQWLLAPITSSLHVRTSQAWAVTSLNCGDFQVCRRFQCYAASPRRGSSRMDVAIFRTGLLHQH